jgi:glycosyltransferase involved in cell wall biosynthesis
MWGEEHVPVNAALLRSLLIAFPEAQLDFYAESQHLNAVRNQLDGHDRVTFHPTTIPPRREKSLWRRVKIELPTLIRARAQTVLLLSAPEATLIAAALTRLLTLGRRRITMVVHVVERVVLTRRGRMLLAFSARLGVRHIVLGRHIHQALKTEAPALSKSFSWLPHPVLRRTPDITTPEPGQPITFAFLGLATEAKGIGDFIECARALQDEPRARFLLVGRVPEESAALVRSAEDIVTIASPDGSRLTRDAYEKWLSRATYFVFPYSQETYRWTASGAALDAIAFAKPMIAYSMPLFEYYEETLGDAGYFCAGREEMIRLMRAVCRDFDSTRYLMQCASVHRGQETLNEAVTARSLREILEPR